MGTLLDEIEALGAIYFTNDEFCVLHLDEAKDMAILSMKISSVSEGSATHCVIVTFDIDHAYPQEVPRLSLSSPSLTREEVERLKKDLQDFAGSLLGEAMLMDIRLWLEENWMGYVNISLEVKEACESENLHICLLHLDHMRAKAKYTKTIEKWTNELSLSGRLIFCDKLILILLQGDIEDIKEYISRQKTTNVDVDSKGRSCKERMMSQLTQQVLSPSMHRFGEFLRVEVQSHSALASFFNEHHLQDIYDEHVKTIGR